MAFEEAQSSKSRNGEHSHCSRVLHLMLSHEELTQLQTGISLWLLIQIQ